ncbi:MAG: SDR family oxidoreductase [Pseudomonadota bacterium]|nr:SDR family oxidoreductase [Pseudomonadota bacterium]
MTTTPPEPRPCVFISGAAAGIGRATAKLFAARGWFVGAGDVDAAALATLADELGAAVMTQPLDVTRTADWDAALATFHARTGRLDVLVNNAGVLISGPFEASPLIKHQAQIAVNVDGVVNGCHTAHRYLATTPGARVINLASSAALYGQASLAGYSATKFFVKGLTEALNIEWQPQGIRVFDLLPLFVQTAMVQDMDARSIQRLGVRLTPDDVAAVIWKAAHYKGWSKVHWTVGLQAAVLYRLGDITPSWINRAVARLIA